MLITYLGTPMKYIQMKNRLLRSVKPLVVPVLYIIITLVNKIMTTRRTNYHGMLPDGTTTVIKNSRTNIPR